MKIVSNYMYSLSYLISNFFKQEKAQQYYGNNSNIIFFFVLLQVNIEYINLLIFICTTAILGVVLMIVSSKLYKLSEKKTHKYKDKQLPYECGFNSTGSIRRVEFQFYILCLFFIIFDLELVLVLPWALNTPVSGYTGLTTILLLFCIFGIGIAYEYHSGALTMVFKFKKEKND